MERIFYNSNLRDPITNYPIYIFDTSYLPSTDLINYDEFIPTLMRYLPTKPYVLVMFSSGLNKISWVWGLKFIKNFMNNVTNLNNLIKIFTVHESWFIKSITTAIYNFHSTKRNIEQLNYFLDSLTIESRQQPKNYQTIVIPCGNLSELSKYLNITNLKISLNIYKYDLQLENEINLKLKFNPIINPHVTLNPLNHPILYHHIYQLLNIINLNCCKTELSFHKPGKKINIDILYQCITRDQLISINDWDLYSISSTFKRILSELPYPLIPINQIPLPMKDDFEYTQSIFHSILTKHKQLHQTQNYDQLLFQLFGLFNKLITSEDTTKHSITSITKCTSHCLSQEVVSTDKSSIQIIQRFMKNVLQHWGKLSKLYSYKSIQDIVHGEAKSTQNEFERSYDVSYEITYEEGSDSNDEDTRLAFNTDNILDSHSTLKIDPQSSNHDKCNGSINPKLPPRPSSVEEDDAPPQLPNRNKDYEKLPKTPTRPKELTVIPNRDPFEEKKDQIPPKNKQEEVPVTKSTAKTPKQSTENKENIPDEKTEIKISIDQDIKRHKEKPLNNVSNLQFLQYPPQKYHFTPTIKNKNLVTEEENIDNKVINNNGKKPVIRGRKVGQLAKLFEERNEGFNILNSL
ncbi:ECM25 [Candida pseudojiufengensis]|uniref:ECM25 n=1 Tax=Candida pseudojiufengensis TaxID=497109 RepID=UPI0022249EE4|nr:ECM25 [Candida pseudojiufengensis]KAI5962419.1 ECM25 [Candida pseudojiufengensis]